MPEDRDTLELSDEFAALYTELKMLAGQVWRSNPSPTLGRTALLNEAYLKLARSESARVVDRAHLKRLAASAMRKILVDAARRRRSLKRGAGWVPVTAENAADPLQTDLDRLIELNDAITSLAREAPRQAELVVLRFFGGLEVREAAAELGISESAAGRDWRAARAWLAVELGQVDDALRLPGDPAGLAALSADWSRLERAFEEARRLPEEERRAHLVRALDGDGPSIARVEAMLRADAIDELPIDRGLDTLAGALLEQGSAAPEQIGPYRIVGQLGRGGMGVVYRGARSDLDREDAIKVLHGTSLSPVLRELFDRERRLLASLRHPSIAQLHDAGTLDDGTPFFVMERIEGLPLDEACARRKLSLESRLELFLQICSAVQYAHTRGVIHRDLKPSNLMVPDGSGPPTVKLLDFGVAERLGSDGPGQRDAAERSSIAAFTPAYAAPEQRDGDPGTVLTDAFSLGVILYELLSRDRPGASTIYRPSTSERRVDSSSRLAWRELDAICARATASVPEDRYATVEAFADDLRRFLEHRPVAALPRTRGYVWGKLARRHRLAVAFAVTVTLLLVGTTGLLFFQSRRIAAERDVAQSERVASLRVSDFLLDLFRASDPAHVRGDEVLARDLLDAAAASLLRDTEDQPNDRIRFMYAIARAYDHLGLYEKQADLIRAALETPGSADRNGPPSTTLLRAELAGAFLQLDRLDEAERLLEEVAGADPEGIPPSDLLAIDSKTAHLRWVQGRLDEAEKIFLRVIPALEAGSGGERTQRYHECVANLGAVYSHQGRFDEARVLYERAIAEMTRRLGDDHPRTLMQRGNLASLEIRQQKFEHARELLEPLLADKRRVLGERHVDTLRSVNGLAVVEHYLGNLDEAELLFREALAASTENLPPGHRETLALVGNLAAVLVDRGKLEEGLELHRRAYDGFRQALGEDHRFTALVLHNLAGANATAGHLKEADRQLGEVQRVWTATLPAGHPNLTMNLEAWADVLRRLGEDERAARVDEQLREIGAPAG